MDIDGFALVTGGASGIGKASCHALAQEGASGVMVADLNLDGARETAAALKSVATHPDFRAEAVQVDVSQEDSVRAAISRMVELFGRIDYSVHSAGVPGGASDPIAAASFPDFKRLLEVNVHGAFLVTSLVSAAMKSQEPRPVHEKYPERGTQRGVIVNLASISSYITLPHMVQYNTSKHAVLAITKTAAIDNEATQVVTGLEQRPLVGIPMGRLCRPEEVADTVLYLCSHRSSFTTGAGIIMDGGMSLSCKT
ncbi:hypothetical protein PG988_011715 [Apiospora saccharicola]